VPISERSIIALVGDYPEKFGDDLYRCGVNFSRNYIIVSQSLILRFVKIFHSSTTGISSVLEAFSILDNPCFLLLDWLLTVFSKSKHLD